jgi:hypothetical protein
MKSMVNRFAIGLGLGAAWIVSTQIGLADVQWRSGSGALPADIQGIIGVFQGDLGGVDNGDSTGLHLTGYRSISWEDVPDASAAPGSLPPDLFNSTFHRGAVLSTLGTGLQASSTLASGVPVRFGNVDPGYVTTFQAYSAERMFAPLGSIVTDVTFFVPGDPAQAAWVGGFGSVFADVDMLGETSIELFDLSGQSLFTGFVPASPSGGLSFLGVSFDAGEQVGRVRITTGNTALGQGVVDGGGLDVVVMDNFYFGEPLAVPEPGAPALFGLGAMLFVGFQVWRRRQGR